MLRYAERRLPRPDLAEDVAAETFSAAWSRWRDRHDVELPWLFRVASNKINDHYRATSRRQAIEEALTRAVEDAPESLDELDRIALRQALLQLPMRERETIMLTYWEGLNASEISKVLDCTVAAVWALLSRARRRLRELIDLPLTPTFVKGGEIDEPG